MMVTGVKGDGVGVPLGTGVAALCVAALTLLGVGVPGAGVALTCVTALTVRGVGVAFCGVARTSVTALSLIGVGVGGTGVALLSVTALTVAGVGVGVGVGVGTAAPGVAAAAELVAADPMARLTIRVAAIINEKNARGAVRIGSPFEDDGLFLRVPVTLLPEGQTALGGTSYCPGLRGNNGVLGLVTQFRRRSCGTGALAGVFFLRRGNPVTLRGSSSGSVFRYSNRTRARSSTGRATDS
jgi:hypothetical protein